jgi:radical SAM protein with 4Fe4S-binding SPASM domain
VLIKFLRSKLFSRRQILDVRPNPFRQKSLTMEERSRLGTRVDYLPGLVYAEISTHCNCACIMCGKTLGKDLVAPAFMDASVFRKILPILSEHTHISLFGRGEPLMHPDFIEILRLTKQQRAAVAFNSNGIALTSEKMAAMVKYGQDVLILSMSGGTPATYEAVHRGAKWEKLAMRLAELNKIKARQRSELPQLYIQFVAMRRNIAELPGLIRWAADFRCRGVMVTYLIPHSDEQALQESLQTPQERPNLEMIFHQSEAIARESGLTLTLPPLPSNPDQSPPTDTSVENIAPICLEPWQTFYVKVTGEVSTCCISDRILGNIGTEDAWSIWNGEKFQNFRQRMLSASKPPECQRCHFFATTAGFNDELLDPDLYKEPLANV